MKKLITCLCILGLILQSFGATITVNVRDISSGPIGNRRVTITLVQPGPAALGNWVFAGDSVSKQTGTNGIATFVNLLTLGSYRLDVAGAPSRSFLFCVSSTNGIYNVAQLLGDCTTNDIILYYTADQVDALMSSFNGGASTNSIGKTNGFGYNTTISNLIVNGTFVFSGAGAGSVVLTDATGTNRFSIKAGTQNTNIAWLLPTTNRTGFLYATAAGTNSILTNLLNVEVLAQIGGQAALGFTPLTNSAGAITNALGYKPETNGTANTISNSLQTAINLKQDALGFTPLTNSAIAIKDKLGYTPLTNTAIAITNTLGYVPETNGTAIAASNSLQTIINSKQSGSVNLTNWSVLATNVLTAKLEASATNTLDTQLRATDLSATNTLDAQLRSYTDTAASNRIRIVAGANITIVTNAAGGILSLTITGTSTGNGTLTNLAVPSQFAVATPTTFPAVTLTNATGTTNSPIVLQSNATLQGATLAGSTTNSAATATTLAKFDANKVFVSIVNANAAGAMLTNDGAGGIGYTLDGKALTNLGAANIKIGGVLPVLDANAVTNIPPGGLKATNSGGIGQFFTWLSATTGYWSSASGANGGTVTSVAVPSQFSVANPTIAAAITITNSTGTTNGPIVLQSNATLVGATLSGSTTNSGLSANQFVATDGNKVFASTLSGANLTGVPESAVTSLTTDLNSKQSGSVNLTNWSNMATSAMTAKLESGYTNVLLNLPLTLQDTNGVSWVWRKSADGKIYFSQTNGVSGYTFDSFGSLVIAGQLTAGIVVASGGISGGDFTSAGVISAAGHFSGSGSALSNVPAAQITGVLPVLNAAALTNLSGTNIQAATINSNKFDSDTQAALNGIAGAGTITSIGASLTSGAIPYLDWSSSIGGNPISTNGTFFINMKNFDGVAGSALLLSNAPTIFKPLFNSGLKLTGGLITNNGSANTLLRHDAASAIVPAGVGSGLAFDGVTISLANNVVFTNAATLWVDPNGSSGGVRGKQTAAYALLSQANAAALAGDTIIINSGSYSETVSISTGLLLAKGITIKASPGAIIILTNSAALASHMLAVQDNLTVEGGKWVAIDGVNASSSGVMALFGCSGGAPAGVTNLLFKDVTVYSPYAGWRYSTTTASDSKYFDCRVFAGYAGLISVAASGGGMSFDIRNSRVWLTNAPPLIALSDTRTAYRLKGVNSGRMELYNCKSVISDAGLTVAACSIGTQAGSESNAFRVFGLVSDVSTCTNPASADVSAFSTSNNFLFSDVCRIDGLALTWTNLSGITNKPWRSSPLETDNNNITATSFYGNGSGLTGINTTNQLYSGSTFYGINTNNGVWTGGMITTNFQTGNWFYRSNAVETFGITNGAIKVTVDGRTGGTTNTGNIEAATFTGDGSGLTLPKQAFVTNSLTVSNLFVDQSIGLDQATNGTANYPFLTLAYAQSQAIFGQTIRVVRGTFNEANLGSNGVTWVLNDGVVLTNNTGPIFLLQSGVTNLIVRGQGTISAASAADVFSVNNTNAVVEITCRTLDGRLGFAANASSNTVYVAADEIGGTAFTFNFSSTATNQTDIYLNASKRIGWTPQSASTGTASNRFITFTAPVYRLLAVWTGPSGGLFTYKFNGGTFYRNGKTWNAATAPYNAEFHDTHFPISTTDGPGDGRFDRFAGTFFIDDRSQRVTGTNSSLFYGDVAWTNRFTGNQAVLTNGNFSANTVAATNGFASYATNVTAWAANTAGYTNIVGYDNIVNLSGTSGTFVFYNRSGAGGATVCGTSLYTNTIIASGVDIDVGVNCGFQIVNGVGTGFAIRAR